MSEEKDDQPLLDLGATQYPNASAPSIQVEPYPGRSRHNLEQLHHPHFLQPPPHSQQPFHNINPQNVYYPVPQQEPFQQGFPGQPEYMYNESNQLLPEQQLPPGQIAQGFENPYGQSGVPPEDVVAQQPRGVTVTPAHNFSKTGRAIRNASIVVSIIACIGGCWWVLLFSIPGILLAMKAMEAAARGEEKTAGNYEKCSACLTMSSVGFSVIIVTSLINVLIAYSNARTRS